MCRLAAVAGLLVLAPVFNSFRQAAVLRGAAEAEDELSSNEAADVTRGAHDSSGRLKFLLGMIEKFKTMSGGAHQESILRHQQQAQALQTGVGATQDQSVKLALAQSLTSNAQSLQETLEIYDAMSTFSESMGALLREVTAKGSGCAKTVCGPHATCTDTTRGAECVCKEGFVGTGQDCHAPAEFAPQQLLFDPAGSNPTQVADVHVAAFAEGTKIVIVFRDTTRNHMGQMVLGTLNGAGTVDLSPQRSFTADNANAYDPVVVGTDSGRVVIAWRDESRGGNAWVRGAVLGVAGIRGTDMAVTWGDKIAVSGDQAHKMSLVNVGGNMVALMYADKSKASPSATPTAFGNSLLAQVDGKGAVLTAGKYRFFNFAVCRLEVTRLSETSFVIAARSPMAVDDMNAAVTTQQEAMAIFGEVADNELVFDPNPVNLAPSTKSIWARGISLIAPRTFAYAYQEGDDNKMKVAVVELEQGSSKMHTVQAPVVVKQGYSPYMNMISVPYSPSDPHTLMYYGNGNASMVNVCKWSAADKKLSKCEDFVWLNQDVTSVSGTSLGGGKTLMVFTPRSGIPYYSIFGIAKG